MRLVDTSSLDSRLHHSGKRVFPRHPCFQLVFSCCLCQCCTLDSSFLVSPYFAHFFLPFFLFCCPSFLFLPFIFQKSFASFFFVLFFCLSCLCVMRHAQVHRTQQSVSCHVSDESGLVHAWLHGSSVFFVCVCVCFCFFVIYIFYFCFVFAFLLPLFVFASFCFCLF